MAALYAPSPVSPTSPMATSPASPTSPPSPTRKAPSPPRHQTPPTPSTPSTGLPQLPFSHSTASLDSPSSGYSQTHSRTPSKVSLTSSIDMRHKDNTIYEHPPSLNLTFPQRSTSHTQLGLSGEEIHNLKFGQRTSSHTQLDLSGEEIHNLKFGQRTSSHTQLDLSSEELNNLKFGQRTTSHMKLKLKHDAKDVEQPLFSPGLNRSFTTHQAQVTQSPQMGVIAGESPRSSRASSHSGDDRDSPESRHSNSDSSSSRRGQSRFEALPENHNSPYLPPLSQQSASPASSQEGISNSRFLAAPGVNYRRSPRPSSVYSSYSDIRGGSPRQHSRAVSAHSYEGRRASHTELPHMQPPPPVLTGNSHLKGVIGTNASLLSTKQTLEMYRANAKKTNDPILQYELAIFMVNAAQQQEILASEGGRAPKRDLDSPYVDTSAQQSKVGLLKEARSILEKLGNKLPQAQYYLADAYASGLFTNGKIENEKAFPLFVAASKRGYAEAGYRTALCYEFGWGCRADPAKAVQYYRQSASKNHPGAMTRLGKACLKDDLGLSGRYKEGVKWLKRATDVADHQYPNAPYELGMLYETGFGDDIFQDLDYAAQLFTQAAELGHVDAFYRMGDAYEHGKLNCPRNAALSVHFYTGAAQGGHLLAMMALCAWYMVGAEPVLEKNEDEAYQWALKAAESGLAKAEYAVGYFTEMGIGCRRDLLEANVWYVKAADHGDKRAKDRLAVIQAAAAGSTTDKKNKKKGKGRDSPNKLEGRRPSGDKECSIM